jgi:hypothetical protein
MNVLQSSQGEYNCPQSIDELTSYQDYWASCPASSGISSMKMSYPMTAPRVWKLAAAQKMTDEPKAQSRYCAHVAEFTTK